MSRKEQEKLMKQLMKDPDNENFCWMSCGIRNLRKTSST